MADSIPDSIPDRNLFMVLRTPRAEAFSPLPAGYRLRHCRSDELPLWKAMHFDDPAEAARNAPFMDGFYDQVYAPYGDLFFEKCLLCVDHRDVPVGTLFTWAAYGRVETLHWFKVIRSFEGRGIGRALLSAVLRALSDDAYPLCLHTQPSSFRAIKLYTDFGFALIDDPAVGHRENHLQECLPILQKHMREEDFQNLRTAKAPPALLEAALRVPWAEF